MMHFNWFTGEISSSCHGQRHTTRCDQIEHGKGRYTLRIFPTEACKHTLDIMYDGDHVPGMYGEFRI